MTGQQCVDHRHGGRGTYQLDRRLATQRPQHLFSYALVGLAQRGQGGEGEVRVVSVHDEEYGLQGDSFVHQSAQDALIRHHALTKSWLVRLLVSRLPALLGPVEVE
eukprot:scaffold1037_cov165-Ochromonas_danica.AAC.3